MIQGPIATLVQPGLKQAYVDRFTLGVERQVVGGLTRQRAVRSPQLRPSLRAHQSGRDVVADRDRRLRARRRDRNIGRRGSAHRLQEDISRRAALREPRRRPPALQRLAVHRPEAARESLGDAASVHPVQTRGNVSNVAQTNWGHPGITGYYSDPNRLINGNGRVPLDFTNSVKLLGTYALPWLGGLRLSGIYQFDSGHTWERRFVVPLSTGPRGATRQPSASRVHRARRPRRQDVPAAGARRNGRSVCRRVQRHQSRRGHSHQQCLGFGVRGATRLVRSAIGEDRGQVDVSE